jgi:3-oxoadipate enol-lactonase
MAYVRTRLGRWFYEERGRAKRAGDPAIVLLHGLLFDGGMWKAQVEPLAALGRVVIIDGPGHGKSELPPPFSLEDHAEALGDALTALAIDRAVLVGLSWGGMVSMRVAIRAPKRVAAMVLMDTAADAEARANVVKYRAFAIFARRFGLPRWFIDAQLAKILFGPRTLQSDPELIERFTRTVNGYDRDGVARAAKAVVLHRKSILADLPRITTPTLVMCGREDAAQPLDRSEAIARGIPHARLAVVEGSGHMSAIEQPAAVNAELVPFVAKHVS